jgi:hypothetical protein
MNNKRTEMTHAEEQYAYNLIDRFLRNNLDDEDYEHFSAALDVLTSPSICLFPLSDEQIHAVRDSFGENPVTLIAFARAIEASHGISK